MEVDLSCFLMVVQLMMSPLVEVKMGVSLLAVEMMFWSRLDGLRRPLVPVNNLPFPSSSASRNSLEAVSFASSIVFITYIFRSFPQFVSL